MRISILAIYYLYWVVSPGAKLPVDSSRGRPYPIPATGMLGIYWLAFTSARVFIDNQT